MHGHQTHTPTHTVQQAAVAAGIAAVTARKSTATNPICLGRTRLKLDAVLDMGLRPGQFYNKKVSVGCTTYRCFSASYLGTIETVLPLIP